MKRQVKGEVVFECDDCGTEHASGTLTFHETIEEMKEAGWKIRPDGEGGWEHFCPECAEEHAS